ncbi:MAG: hypothetical protein E6K59_09885 [Nitrospirae bacterium]|nr:MAG: hypothetical protein E6K59_09885 [Nitrospirota bacterium]
MNAKLSTAGVILGMALGLAVGVGSPTSADVTIPGMGSGAYDVPSVGGPGDSVDKAPVCDMRARPKITKVEPDPMKPGDKITIKGENFGTKECFVGVSFGSVADSAKVSFNYVNEPIIRRGPKTPTRSSRPASASPSTCPRALCYPVALSEGECLRESSSPTAARAPCASSARAGSSGSGPSRSTRSATPPPSS